MGNIISYCNDKRDLFDQYAICRRKLQSKCEALLILSRDLDQCRQERDQFKLMAEQVQERYQDLKRQLAGVGPRRTPLDGMDYAKRSSQNLAQLLCEMRDVNKSLQFEVDDLKQKLFDAVGDIKLLRGQIARQRVGTTDEGMNTRHFPAHEREELVSELEAAKEQFRQLERDLEQVLDEKEELVTERDVYKNKYERLNTELSYILKGDERRVVDLDALIMDNKYLKERTQQMEEEKAITLATLSKYKGILEKKKNKGIKQLGQNRSGGVVITQKQVVQLLEDKVKLASTPQMVADLQSLAGALLETVNDKNLALTHQRKTNRLLGTRVSELEKKLKTLEVSGLWNVPGGPNLDKLKEECEEIRTLIPKQMSLSSEDGLLSPDSTPRDTPLRSTDPPPGSATNGVFTLEDLDLLPTKEDSSCEQDADRRDLTVSADSALICAATKVDGDTPTLAVPSEVYSYDFRVESSDEESSSDPSSSADPLSQGPVSSDNTEGAQLLTEISETSFFSTGSDMPFFRLNHKDDYLEETLLQDLVTSAPLKVTASRGLSSDTDLRRDLYESESGCEREVESGRTRSISPKSTCPLIDKSIETFNSVPL